MQMNTATTCIIMVIAAAASGGACADDDGRWHTSPCTQGVQQVVTRFVPQWLKPGPFVIKEDPVKPSALPPVDPTDPSDPDPPENPPPLVWGATGTVPEKAVFQIPFQGGDRILGVSFDAVGDPGGKGLSEVHVYYVGNLAGYAIELASGSDTNRSSQEWGRFDMEVEPTDLASDGVVWVELSVAAVDYYVGLARTLVQRTCDYTPI